MLHCQNTFLCKNKESQIFSKWDWIIFGILSIFCFVSFQQADILHTAGSSIAYLNGHVWDFYSYNANYVGGNAYMPTTYILYAIWMIPIRLFGILTLPTDGMVAFPVLMWYKLFPTLFFLASAYLMYLICIELKMGEKKAKLGMYLLLSTPTAFFSQFIFGQYDSITLLLVMLGIYFWLKDKKIWFAIFFGFAITCKYFALLLYIPMLFLREKKYLKIIQNVIVAALPFAAETLFYLHDGYFKSGVFGFSSVGYITNVSFSTGFANISVVVVLWVVLSMASYLINPKDKEEEFRYFLVGGYAIIYLIFGLSMWHPQWLMFATPFFVLALLTTKKFDLAVIVDLLIMVCFVGFTVNFWTYHVDQEMLCRGIWNSLIQGKLHSGWMMRDFFIIQDVSLWFSAFSALLLARILLILPKQISEDRTALQEHWLAWTRTRFLAGVAIFVLPAMLCLTSMILSTPIVYANDNMQATIAPMETVQDVSEQWIQPQNDFVLKKIGVYPGTYLTTHKGTLTVSVINENDEIISTAQISLQKLVDCKKTVISLPETELKANENYAIRLNVTSESGPITFFYTQEPTDSVLGELYVNGTLVEGTLCLTLFGETK